MNSTDADKLPHDATARAPVTKKITCNAIENRSLGDDLNNILYVKNVEATSDD